VRALKERKIWCEHSLERIWGLFLYFENEPVAKDHLYRSYIQTVDEKEATRLAFDNTLKFIFFLKQGGSYFKSAQNSELIVRPLLLYYGFTSLMKAIILSKDPYYPKTTSVLQHGITTRKRKKSNYLFHEDEIKVQKDGLLPHFAQTIFHQPLVVHSKHKIFDLLSLLPELQTSFEMLYGKKTTLPVIFKYKSFSSITLSFNEDDLSLHSLDKEKLLGLATSFLEENELIESLSQDNLTFRIYKKDENYTRGDRLPMFSQVFKDYKGNDYFYYYKKVSMSNEIMIYNMIMYILGMLCRYDTELWGELLFTFSSSDMYIIEEFLQLSMRKFPNLILNYLFDEMLFFTT
jgi:hypothetical protein